jgi:hypothetical protein
MLISPLACPEPACGEFACGEFVEPVEPACGEPSESVEGLQVFLQETVAFVLPWVLPWAKQTPHLHSRCLGVSVVNLHFECPLKETMHQILCQRQSEGYPLFQNISKYGGF